uniref:LINE-1 type transposase domain-containing 1 n=1 Tax=Knipowitschia caucasica TaxID=637954 RepID=A0AAV2M6H3_KNICA
MLSGHHNSSGESTSQDFNLTRRPLRTPHRLHGKEAQELEVSASLTSTITDLLTEKLAEHKAEFLAEVRDIYTKYESKLENIETSVDDHELRIMGFEQFADSTSTDLMAMQATLTAVVAENAKLRAKVSDLEGLYANGIFLTTALRYAGSRHSENKSPPELDRAHRTLAAKPGPSGKPRPVVICFHDFKTRELVVRGARKLRGKLNYNDAPFLIFEEYSPEVLEQRTPYRDIMKKLYEMGLKPALRYPARLFVVLDDGTKKLLPSLKEATDFADSWARQHSTSPTEQD